MPSLRNLEGYMLIDHRNSPGLPEGLVAKQGTPGAGTGLFESPTFTCSHCEAVVIMNPDRSRSRGYCRKCDHYVCDGCESRRVASAGECYPFKALVQDLLNAADRKPASSEVFQSPVIVGV